MSWIELVLRGGCLPTMVIGFFLWLLEATREEEDGVYLLPMDRSRGSYLVPIGVDFGLLCVQVAGKSGQLLLVELSLV